ncbi:MAG TPA: hypothetical protein VF744_11705 [Beijerinckiaceae bacterium]|jgi:hypothetical protein
MRRRFSRVGFVVFAGSLGLATGALAQGFPTYFAPRCQPDELRAGTGQSRDPCAPQVAMFGLNGPTVIGADAVIDVETTGSIAGTRGPDRRPVDGSAPRK